MEEIVRALKSAMAGVPSFHLHALKEAAAKCACAYAPRNK
jgi:hypothetical protein